MIYHIKYLLTSLLLCVIFNLNAQIENSNCNKIVATINSTHLNQENEFWIGLPTNYDSTVTYPVIYLLDAEDHFDITLAVTNQLAKNDKMPQHILIGIPKVDNFIRFKNLTFNKKNPLDYDTLINPTFFNNTDNFGGGFTYLKYIESELIPRVDKAYKTNGYNILIGHSLGGYFGAYAVPIQNSFSAFQLYDPSVFCNSNEAIKHFKDKVKDSYSTNLYITSALAKKEGDSKGKEIALNAIDTLIENIANYEKIRLGSKFYPEEGHLSMYMYSLIDGFTFLYEGFEFGYIQRTMEVTIETYAAHYEKLSRNLGFEFTPPLDGIRWVAYANHHQKKWNEALKAYQLCKEIYADDFQVNLEIAECYLNLNNFEASLKHYNICKTLNGSTPLIDEKIKELEAQVYH